ncbi:hypothetical protein, partial [Listeria monocytogenes]|uniref:hypothetical protein n=1 Tax=Listeria monocytogenes TaxID=1639 RepID=UPI0034A1B681
GSFSMAWRRETETLYPFFTSSNPNNSFRDLFKQESVILVHKKKQAEKGGNRNGQKGGVGFYISYGGEEVNSFS